MKNSDKYPHRQLVDILWNQQEVYYDSAQESSEDFSGNAGLQSIQRVCRQSKNVLGCGCGEGQKLALMSPINGVAYGVDVSRLALKRAQRFPEIRLVEANLVYLPYPDQSFEATYSAYVIEHVQNPERVLDEMIRVTKCNGYVMIIAPNYGSPVFPSPPSQVHRRFRHRGIRRLIQTHFHLFRSNTSDLMWDFVQPLTVETGKYRMDWDTTVEPYLLTLIQYLRTQGLKVIDWSSQFEVVSMSSVSFRDSVSGNKSELLVRLLFGFLQLLARHNIPPYKYYGPVCCVIAQK